MHFNVDKIPCGGCSSAVEKKINTEFPSGVRSVAVDIMLKKMKVTIEEDYKDEITPEAITLAVQEIGKECELDYVENPEDKRSPRRASMRKIFDESESKRSHFITFFIIFYSK